jgi:glycosyltransferase involved in cell wall biosynthesis
MTATASSLEPSSAVHAVTSVGAMRLRLLFVVNVDWFFISHRLPIAQEALARGYEVHIGTALTGRRAELEGAGLVVHELALSRSADSLSDAWRTMRQILHLYRLIRPDLVHLVTIKPVLLGGLMARLAKVPAVVSAVSGLGFAFAAKGLWSGARRLLLACLYRMALDCRNQKVIFQNPDDRAMLTKLARLAENRVVTIRGSGADLGRFTSSPWPDGLPIVLLASRMLADKGVREFAQAARELHRRGVRARFCLVGAVDPDNPASLSEDELQQLASPGGVEVWGQRNDMVQVLQSARLVVLPSYREGLPKILIEAQACGRAVVTTDVPGCRDAIDPGVTGLLVPARDPAALADAMELLLRDPQRCAAMGQAARAWAERCFDLRQVVTEHLRIYDELLATS